MAVVVGQVLAVWLAVWSSTGSAAAVARPSTDTVRTIVQALNTPAIAMQLMYDNGLALDSLLNGKNETLLHIIAGLSDDQTSRVALDYILSQEEDKANLPLHAVDTDGLQPLHTAAKLGKQDTVGWLLQQGALPATPDKLGKSPLDYAEEGEHTEIATLLRAYVGIEDDASHDSDAEPDFLLNLNERAAAGEIDPVVGRIDEVMAVLEILSKRRKNNPLLVGAAGVGKTAIAEGIADLIVRGEVPAEFLGKTLYNVDIGTLTAGTGGPGMLEGRVKELLQFAENNPDTLFFIDEIHLIAADSAAGSMGIANQLKPALEKGCLRCIGATTDAEHHRHILSDKALNRRFSIIRVGEPSKKEALEIAFAARDRLAAHHDIEITDNAVVAAVDLSRYLPERNLPDVALELIDEAAAALKFNRHRVRLSLVDIAAKITRRKDNLTWMNNQRKQQAAAEIKQLKKEQEQQDKALATHVDTKLEALQTNIHALETNPDTDTGLLDEAYRKLKRVLQGRRLQAHHIAELIARKQNIPVGKILKAEQDILVTLEADLQQRIFGQNEAIKAIADTLKVGFAGLNLDGHVLGSFLLLGTTGVGKSYMAEMVAELLFGDKRYLLRFDMSEYAESHTISTLLGAPPGYVGYGEGGALTSAVLRTPHAVILFDEIEKAHPRFQNILLQILEGAHLTDRSGEKVDFSNVVIIMTSNSDDPERDFRPEVRNRIDDIIVFAKLNSEVMQQLVQVQLTILNQQLQNKKVTVSLSDEVVAQLSEDGYDKENGARPLQRLFRQRIKVLLSEMIVSKKLKRGHYIFYLNEDGEIALRREKLLDKLQRE